MTNATQHTQGGEETNAVKRLIENATRQLQRGQFDQVLKLCKQALELAPSNPAIHLTMGMVLEHLKDKEGALQSYNQAYQNNPANPTLAKQLAMCLMRIGQYETAANLAAKPGRVLPYALSVEAMRRYLERVETQQDTAWQARLAAYDRLIQELALKADSKDRLLSLFNNFRFNGNHWKARSLGHLEDKEFWQWVKITGLDQVKECLASGKGVLMLNTHSTVGRIATLAFARLGLKFTSLESANYLGREKIPIKGNVNFIEVADKGFLLREVHQARQVLLRGEILHMAPDGRQGGNSVTHKFFHRSRSFSTGFADLAILTGASAFPLSCTSTLDGHIHIEILPPLTVPDASLARDGKVHHYISQYVTFLEYMWKKFPSSIFWNQIEEYLSPTEPRQDNQ